jgi:hypothetical protein
MLLLLAFTALTIPATATAAKKELIGTFKLDRGKSVGSKADGSYFRMIYPNGKDKKGPFFINPNSKAKNKSYTLFTPGIDGGLRTGAFQVQPNPAFQGNGFSLANRIIKPLLFAGIKFGLSTAPTDPQSGKDVAPPRIWADGRRISGDLRGFTASWNKIFFNQGAPKPGGSAPGLTRPVKGIYNARTKRFSFDWVSQIVGGPFNDFSGYWHFEGKFVPGS